MEKRGIQNPRGDEVTPQARSNVTKAGACAHAVFVSAVTALSCFTIHWQATTGTILLTCYLAIWLALSLRAIRLQPTVMRMALSLTIISLLPLAFQWARRAGFVLEHDGMDCATCQGSPLLFLYGWIIESILLLGGAIAASLLFLSIRRQTILRGSRLGNSPKDS